MTYDIKMIKKVFGKDFKKFRENVKRDIDATKDLIQKQRLKNFLKDLK